MVVPAALVTYAQIAEAVDKAIADLGPEVVQVKHTIGPDTYGDLALYFRIILEDWAATRENLFPVSRKIERTLIDRLHPYENWGIFPHFSYRSRSEQSPDREWR